MKVVKQGTSEGDSDRDWLPSGLPLLKESEKSDLSTAQLVKLFFILVVELGIGVLLAVGALAASERYAIFSGRTSNPGVALDVIQKFELEYLYIALVILGRTVSWVNMYPMVVWKQRVMHMKAGNLRANMQIFKMIGDGAGSNAIVLETEGDVGGYNRANRSLTHMVENMAAVLVLMLAVGFVYPLLACLFTTLWCFGRVSHQMGYATGGYGKHGAGFGLSAIASGALQGLCCLIVWKTILR
ncbi:unnamed protein product [Amoebophrya sp. A25]|nr:unnamed protein product [Amoebophrya sp. A25]|eukprot:GSA25T00017307001.1